MSKPLKVCLYTDEVASLSSTPEEEYEELEDDVRRRLVGFDPGAVQFTRGVLPDKLRDHPCDVYVIDFGGIVAYPEWRARGNLVGANLLAAARETPSTYFLVWSSMSAEWFKGRLYDELIDKMGGDGDACYDDSLVPPNVLLYPSGYETRDVEAQWAKLRGYLGLPEVVEAEDS